MNGCIGSNNCYAHSCLTSEITFPDAATLPRVTDYEGTDMPTATGKFPKYILILDKAMHVITIKFLCGLLMSNLYLKNPTVVEWD